jgi:hypothetical protein
MINVFEGPITKKKVGKEEHCSCSYRSGEIDSSVSMVIVGQLHSYTSNKPHCCVKSEISPVLGIKIAVSWDVTACSLKSNTILLYR